MNALTKEEKQQIQKLLEENLITAKKRLAELESQDPFLDTDRLADNAANDREAQEEEGHDRIKAQIETITHEITEITAALTRMTDGIYGVCQNCGGPIENKRLRAFPTATTCMTCQGAVQ